MTGAGGPLDASVLDLDQYDLPGLRSDISEILDLPNAVVDIAKSSTRFVFLGGFGLWLVFRPRMALWALAPYLAVLITTLLLAVTAFSVFAVLRKRLQATDEAADRTLFTVAAMHGDLIEHKSTGGELPLREVASFLTQTLVFPILTGSAGAMLDSAATVSGPVGFLSGRVLTIALGQVERRVLEALDEIQEEQTENPPPPPVDGQVVDSWENLPVDQIPNEIRGFYEDVHRYLSRVVDGVEVVTIGGAYLTTVLAFIPFFIVLVLGFVLS